MDHIRVLNYGNTSSQRQGVGIFFPTYSYVGRSEGIILLVNTLEVVGSAVASDSPDKQLNQQKRELILWSGGYLIWLYVAIRKVWANILF